MISSLLSPFSYFQNQYPEPEYEFTEMREDSPSKDGRMVEMSDFSDAIIGFGETEIKESLLPQIRSAAKMLIPNTELVKGHSYERPLPVSDAFYRLSFQMGDICMEKVNKIKQHGVYFTVRTRYETELNLSGRLWSFSAKIVSVELHTENRNSELRDIALEILEKAQSILDRAESMSGLIGTELKEIE